MRNTMYERLTKRFLGSNAPYTEFTDNEILNRLCEIEDKICDGRMVELPCALGDTLFGIYHSPTRKICVFEYEVTEIVPPCKVGQTVYMPWEWNGSKAVAILEVTRIVDDFTECSPYVNTNFFSDDEDYWVAYNCGRFEFKDFGKTVFLTKEEAEKALAERGYKK